TSFNTLSLHDALPISHVFHLYEPVYTIELHSPARLIIFQFFIQDFASALETGDSFRDLRADGNNLKNRRHKQAQKDVERKKRTERHRARKNLVRAKLHDDGADDAH